MDPAPPSVGQDIRVVDGDTIDIDGIRHRLAGFDAPERHQDCIDASGLWWECGAAATWKLEELIGAGPVTCYTWSQDRYGRSVSSCSAGGVRLGAALTQAGLALNDRRYSPDYSAEEGEAREAEAGMHAGRFMPPWSWRAGWRLTPLNPSILSSDAFVYGYGIPRYREASCDLSACTISIDRAPYTIVPEEILPQLAERVEDRLLSHRETLDDETLIEGYGAWITQSGFAVLHFPLTSRIDITMAVSISDHFPATNPRKLDGGATWHGSMAGIHALDRTPLLGRSKVTMTSFSDPLVDVVFTEIRDIGTDAARPDLMWSGMAVENGGFSTADKRGNGISGRFYGDTHQEVGGVFKGGMIVGGYGATRGR